MAIRIHKAIGYGLTDVRVKDYEIDDPRINAGSFLLAGHVDHREDHLSYGRWLERRADGDKKLLLNITQELDSLDSAGAKDAYETVLHDAEYGLPGVLLVRPVGFSSWYRRDDQIDYEEEHRGAGPGNRVTSTVGGIHPWSGLYMDTRTGERIKGNLVNAWRQMVNGGSEDQELLDGLAQGLGYKDHAEAERYVAPFVPREIRRLCEWGGLFTSPDVVLQLRPLLYIYWA